MYKYISNISKSSNIKNTSAGYFVYLYFIFHTDTHIDTHTHIWTHTYI